MLNQGRALSDMAMVMSAIPMIIFIGILIELLVCGPPEKRLLRGRGPLTGSSR